MLGRLFGNVDIAPKNMDELSREETIALTKQHFYSTYSTCEVDSIFPATQALLNELSLDDPDFNGKYDAIIFGTIAVARAILDWHDGFGPRCYSKTFKELCDLFGIKSVVLMGDSANDPSLRALLSGVGAKILDGLLPFKAEYLSDTPLAQKYVPLLQRLNVYRPEIVGENQVLTPREKSLIKNIESQQETIAALRQQLDTANAKIVEMKPKAQWHDEEQERRRAAEEEAKLNKKHRFRHFGRHRD